jgi:hypothetical protein
MYGGSLAAYHAVIPGSRKPSREAQQTGLIMSALDDLGRKLRMRQTPSKDAAKMWAQRTRALVEEGKTWDQGAMIAATELFASDFKPTEYDTQKGSIEALVDAIEELG